MNGKQRMGPCIPSGFYLLQDRMMSATSSISLNQPAHGPVPVTSSPPWTFSSCHSNSRRTDFEIIARQG